MDNFNSNMNNGYQDNINGSGSEKIENNNNKYNLKNIIIIVGVVLIIVVALVLLLQNKDSVDNNDAANNNINNNSGNTDNVNDKTNSDSPSDLSEYASEDLKKNITITSEKTAKGNLVLFIKNNNNVTVTLSADFIPYDASNNRIFIHDFDGNIYSDEATKKTWPDVRVSFVALGPGEEVIKPIETKISLPGYDHYILENYEVKVAKGFVNCNKDIKLISEKLISNDTLLQVDFENNGSNTIDDIRVDVLYYKDGKPLGVEGSTFTKAASGKKETKNFIVLSDENSNKVAIDSLSWKIYIHAYSFE